MKRLFILSFLLVMYSCNTLLVSIPKGKRAAKVDLPSTIKNITTINKTRNDSKLERVLSGEIFSNGVDNNSTVLISKVSTSLNNMQQFWVVSNNKILKTTNSREFGSKIDSNDIKEQLILKNAKGIIALECFDIDSSVQLKNIDIIVLDKNGKDVSSVGVQATKLLEIIYGWRFYDSASSILDTYKDTVRHIAIANGLTNISAIAKLPSVKTKIDSLLSIAAYNYSTRISTSPIHITRYLISKGNKEMRLAKKLARKKSWENAEQIWLQQSKSPSNKIAGYAMYCLAICEERKGNMDMAMKYCEKAAFIHNNYKAKSLDYEYHKS